VPLAKAHATPAAVEEGILPGVNASRGWYERGAPSA
jgi:hypothetical protein